MAVKLWLCFEHNEAVAQALRVRALVMRELEMSVQIIVLSIEHVGEPIIGTQRTLEMVPIQML